MLESLLSATIIIAHFIRNDHLAGDVCDAGEGHSRLSEQFYTKKPSLFFNVQNLHAKVGRLEHGEPSTS